MNFLMSAFKMLSIKDDSGNLSARGIIGSTESLVEAVPLRTQVLLKIRPTSPPVQYENQYDVYTVENTSTLSVKHFNSSDAATRRSKLMNSSDDVIKKKFTFSRIFNFDTSQSKFFNDAIKPVVIDFLSSQSSTIMSYGTCDSGKTYTLFGTVSDPGIIPRSIELIYSSISCTLEPWFKPERVQSVINLNEFERNFEIDAKQRILFTKNTERSACEEAYEKLEKSELNMNLEILKDSMCSVWISFVEIYNDVIFDLLEVDAEGKNVQLKLATDKHGAPYIQGIRSICASTGSEAYQIMTTGQSRLTTASTANHRSSRSHSIFTIKLLKYEKNCELSDVKVSSLTFCDLAGTGRSQTRGGNTKQFQELKSINTSLSALSRCMKVITGGNRKQSAGPFRDCKLTRLFQQSLCSKTNTIFLINVNPTLDLLAETQSVLNFASLAMKLTSDSTKEEMKTCDPEMMNSSIMDNRSQKELRSQNEPDTGELLMKNKKLIDEIKKMKLLEIKKEYEIRRELSDFYSKQLNELDENWRKRMLAIEEEKKNLLQFSVSQVENFYKGKLDEYKNRKRRKTNQGDFEDFADLEIFETENIHFASQIISVRKSLESIKSENEMLSTQKNQQAYELSLIKDSLRKIAESSTKLKQDPNKSLQDSSFEKGDDGKVSLDAEVCSHLSWIREKLNEFFESKARMIESNSSQKLSSEAVQCDLVQTVVDGFCRELKMILDPDSVELPDLNDSLDSLEPVESRTCAAEDVTSTLSRLKQLILERMAKANKFEKENNEISNQFGILKREIVHRDAELMKVKEQFEESESQRRLLSKTVESLQMKLSTSKFFRSPEISMVEAETELYHGLTSPNRQSVGRLTNDLQLNSSASDSDKIDTSTTRSSSASSKDTLNDSGLASSVEIPVCRGKIEKCSQTSQVSESEHNQSFQDRLSQLKLDYNQMKIQHFQETSRVSELSQELMQIRDAMSTLKTNLEMRERTIIEYERKMNTDKLEIDHLKEEKKRLETECKELSENLQNTIAEYEKRLADSQLKLKVYEEGENRTARCLENYWEKSVNLGSELSMAYSELEKSTIKCFRDHVLKIDQLEKELSLKISNETKLEEKLMEYEKDFSTMNQLLEKVKYFENLLEKIENEKIELNEMMRDRAEDQEEIEEQMQNLVQKIEERDNEVSSLKSELNSIISTNLNNSRRAKDLGEEVTSLMGRMSQMKDEIIQSEQARRDLEKSSNDEIISLRNRLTIFEENAELLNVIHNTSDNQQKELDHFRSKLEEKERELEFFKKNRNATIQRYESLVHQLQDALKMNHHSGKFKKLFSQKQKYSISTPGEVHAGHPRESQRIEEWKSRSSNDNYPLLCSSVRSIQYSSSTGSYETLSNSRESSCLAMGCSYKSPGAGRRPPSQMYSEPCRDSSLPNNHESPSKRPNSKDPALHHDSKFRANF
ncbi:hypothetical protein QAD02_016891 [Eretmocerus hayati]|uniref:Uncharacterized protein n=1 Tax=Eretmocerus hayati TaxID=131215 RepID=A0ACC2PCT5_9HYME|nr:hypothetical protein QAD02_016891 [Eretmocerus hayati]